MNSSYIYKIEEIEKSTDIVSKKYKNLFFVFESICKELTADDNIRFATEYARLTFLLDKNNVHIAMRKRIMKFRADAINSMRNNAAISAEQYREDYIALALFVSLMFGEQLSESQKRDLEVVSGSWTTDEYRHTDRISHLRIVTTHCDYEYITGYKEDAEEYTQVKVKINVIGQNSDFAITPNMVWNGCIVNLIDSTVEPNGDLCPKFIIINPDYLMECSSIADCVTPCGPNPLEHLFKKLMRAKTSKAMLLGNIANYFHDRLIHAHDKSTVDFKTLINEAFLESSLSISTCEELQNKDDYDSWIADAESHYNNIKNVVETIFPEVGISTENVLLEPTFFCDQLGLSGRLDLLHQAKGNYAVVEMKSGKSKFPETQLDLIADNHITQAFLYQAIVQRVLQIPFNELKTYIFYTKYPYEKRANLRYAKCTLKNISEALNLRNRIVCYEHLLANAKSVDDVRRIVSWITPQYMIPNYDKVRSERIVSGFIVPKIEEFRHTIDSSSQLEQKYFYSMLGFIAKEQDYAKTGGSGTRRNHYGFASCWRESLEEKKESGNIIFDLHPREIAIDTAEPYVVFDRTPNDEYTASFRVGDIVVIYERQNDTDLATNKLVLRGTIAEITNCTLRINMRQTQRNPTVLRKDMTFAIERDFIESSFTNLYSGLYTFINTKPERKRLLLGETLPKPTDIHRRGVYANDDINRIVEKAKSTDSYFLLAGPPGTGKTSFALKSMVEEFYEDDGKILLMAYTNRAVDEICNSLNRSEKNIDFIRIGSRLNADKRFLPNILSERIKNMTTPQEVTAEIRSHKVYVGTTTAMLSNKEIFHIINFDVAIIDEASQILEPQIIGLLSEQTRLGEYGIKKFIMIGDHKQLPAVVAQSENESKVEDEDLRNIGLTNRRNSLFERLFRLNRDSGNDCAWDTLRGQGRMHNEICKFPNDQFYNGELHTVADWQNESFNYYKNYDKNNRWETLVATRRMAYIPSERDLGSNSGKTNDSEANIVTEIVKACVELRKKNGIADADMTIGVITGYRSQIAKIRHKLEEAEVADGIVVDTVERYQGGQMDIIIYSFCVNQDYQLDFVCDAIEENGKTIDRKLNVALTRARKQLFVVGNEEMLRQVPIYSTLIDFMK